MPGPLAAVERFFERLFERPAARLFRTRLQPVQLQRRLERTMEGERRLGADRTYVPNRYRVRLHPQDLEAFASYRATLESELEEALLTRARRQGYTLVERPRVSLEEEEGVRPGDIDVQAEVLDPLLLRPAPAGFRRVADPAAGADRGPDGSGPAGTLEQTAVFELPKPSGPRLVLLVLMPDGREQRHELEGGTFRIGRANDNDLPLPDDRVSRYHGQLVSRQGTIIYRDLGSTNGSFLNGAAVTEIALGPGDVLQVGGSRLTVLVDP
jgi:hypothetical protein